MANTSALDSAIASVDRLRERNGLPALTQQHRETIVHDLSVTGGQPGKRKRDIGPDSTAKELRRVAKNINDLLSTLAGLHDAALSVFRPGGLAMAKAHLRALKIIAEEAAKDPPISSKRLTSNGAQKLAFVAACEFWRATGEKPTIIVRNGTACGPFMDFLSTVFKARNVRVSVENSAKWAISTMGLNRSKRAG